MRATVKLGMLLGAAMLTGAAADAQAPGAPFPPPGVNHPPMPPAPRAQVPHQSLRWGSQIGGRWWGGANAPGGWASYRQPQRGWRVPRYWVTPRFYINDWARYGLAQPSGGSTWVRYYDDAVLIDGNGGVQDWRGGLDWNRGDYAYDDVPAGAYHDRNAPPVIVMRDGPPPPGYDDRGPLPGMHDGPPPHREERRVFIRRQGGPGYPGAGGPGTWVSGDGRTTVTTTTSGYGGAYVGGAPVIVQSGYGYAGGVTTITVQSAPVVTTTTTTEIIEDRVTYSRAVVRHVARRAWRPRPVRVCPPVRRHRAPAVLGS